MFQFESYIFLFFIIYLQLTGYRYGTTSTKST